MACTQVLSGAPGNVASLVMGLAAVLQVGCNSAQAAPPDSRLASVESEIAAAKIRLEGVRAEVAASEARAAAARAEAEFQGCRARVTGLRAEVERRRAQCAKQVADQNLCVAHNSERTANSGILGCGFGLVAAAVTGGAAAPWGLGGCAAGLSAGELAANECPLPACAANLETIEDDVVRENGLEALPRCGGFAGIEVAEQQAIARQGLPVERVVAGTYADSASMAAGDVLTAVQGTSVRDPDQLKQLLEKVRVGSPLAVTVVRGGRLFKLTAPASKHVSRGRLLDTVQLGAILGKPVSQVSYRSGVVVTKVAPDSPAAAAGISAGDQLRDVTTAGGEPAKRESVQPADIESALGDLAPNTRVDVHLMRDGKRAIAHLQLEPRARRAAL